MVVDKTQIIIIIIAVLYVYNHILISSHEGSELETSNTIPELSIPLIPILIASILDSWQV